ncbi:MAG: hypothetical protein NTW86_21665 [Candidatus Sumerlaeota bacterium]|nr:hypothetical protein [Candidatus Sumerlaeota bacterium]
MGKSLTAPNPVKRAKRPTSASAKVEQYKARLEELFQTVEAWAKEWSPKAQVKRIPSQITEPVPGAYSVDILEIQQPGLRRPVRLRPLGCYIVGAEGRVEVESNLDHESLMYIPGGGPDMTIQVGGASGRLPKHSKARTLRKETAEGWVWVQSRLMGLYPTLNDDLMHRMVEVLGR